MAILYRYDGMAREVLPANGTRFSMDELMVTFGKTCDCFDVFLLPDKRVMIVDAHAMEDCLKENPLAGRMIFGNLAGKYILRGDALIGTRKELEGHSFHFAGGAFDPPKEEE